MALPEFTFKAADAILYTTSLFLASEMFSKHAHNLANVDVMMSMTNEISCGLRTKSSITVDSLS